ncbi:type II toxin-antitoxin system VapC family toxin [Candidatus Poriferisodalis sp.]|uniref:type II toxin-antitoxin system VapC family toxin n=1 Tax=Candidatus Poriferisodalis sp. TaxID=3101277 RepID=UPI003B528FEB
MLGLCWSAVVGALAGAGFLAPGPHVPALGDQFAAALEHSCQTLVDRLGADWLDLTAAHAMGLRTLPYLHADPFDRLLVAQSMIEGHTLVTTDEKVLAYPISTLTA